MEEKFFNLSARYGMTGFSVFPNYFVFFRIQDPLAIIDEMFPVNNLWCFIFIRGACEFNTVAV